MENCIVLFSFMNYIKHLNVFLCVFLKKFFNSAHSVFLKHPEILLLH